MNHWSEALPDDEDTEQTFVRPYTITRGRTSSAREDLTLITVIATIAGAEEPSSVRGLQPEHTTILDQCRTPVALVEVAAMLNLPVAVTKILVSDLLSLGRVMARPPMPVAGGEGPDITLLQAVKDGLLRL